MRKKARLFYFNKNFGPLGALVGEEHAATVSWLLNIVLSSRTGYGVSKTNYLTVRPELSRRAPLGFSQSLAVEMTQAVNRDVSGIATQSATGRIEEGGAWFHLRGDQHSTPISIFPHRSLCRNVLFAFRRTQISPSPSFQRGVMLWDR
jgi:hypothetical protein